MGRGEVSPLRPEEMVGQVIWSLDRRADEFEPYSVGNWEPRKAVSSRPVLAEPGPAVVPE